MIRTIETTVDETVVGGGQHGLSTALFTVENGLDTAGDESVADGGWICS